MNLASVLDGISISVVSMSLKKVLSFRAVELALRGLRSTEGVHEQIAEQTVAILGPQIKEEIVDVPVPQMRREVVEVTACAAHQRASRWSNGGYPGASGHGKPWLQEVVKLVPQERVQQRTVQLASVPQILEETAEVVLTPAKRVLQRTIQQVPVPSNSGRVC